MLLSVLMLAMILRRNSIKGQSFVIGLVILAGDICGCVMSLIAKQTVDPNIIENYDFTKPGAEDAYFGPGGILEKATKR